MFFMDFQTVRRLRARKFVYTLQGSVPAFNGAQAGAVEFSDTIQTGFSFWSELLTISFTTLNSAGADDGVCTLSCQFKDGANQVGLSNTFVDLSTLSAPGRQRAVGVAGDPSNQLAASIPWPHLYLATGQIQVDLRNSSNTANLFKGTWNGYLVPDSSLAAFDQWVSVAVGM